GRTGARADAPPPPSAEPTPPAAPPKRRSAALRTYLAANQARAVLPAVESSGAVQPSLRPRED
ncbi:MAG: hypothetical protein ACK4Z5_11880, partial [Brevundimonas sp.]